MKRNLSLLLSIALFFGVVPNASATEKPSLEFTQKEFLLFSSGKVLEEAVVLKNLTDRLLEVDLSWVPYSRSGIKVVRQDYQRKHSIDFASLAEDRVTLQPFEAKTVLISFTTPAEIKSGDYYGSLSANSGQTTVEASFTLRVLGQLSEEISSSAYFEDKKLKIDISNTSNKTTQSKVSASLDSVFGSAGRFDFTTTKLLSGQTAVLETSKLNLLPGYYQAKIDIQYSDKGLNKTLIASFWVHPEFFVVSTLTLLISVLGFIYFRTTLRSDV